MCKMTAPCADGTLAGSGQRIADKTPAAIRAAENAMARIAKLFTIPLSEEIVHGGQPDFGHDQNGGSGRLHEATGTASPKPRRICRPFERRQRRRPHRRDVHPERIASAEESGKARRNRCRAFGFGALIFGPRS